VKDRSRPSYMSARRQRHLERLRDERRRLSSDEARRVVRMKEQRGLTYSAIAAWFTRNGTPISYQAVRETYRRERAA
jgi:hypothetical protein